MHIRYCIIPILMILAVGCRKKPDPVASETQMSISFDNRVNGQAMKLYDQWYTNAHGDSFNVENYRYYISNIILSGDNGVSYTEPESYHLIDEQKAESKQFTIKGLPVGTYTSVSFLIGVDSARNTSGAQTGALDPANAMFWDWNTGYIMTMFEGSTPVSSSGIFAFHLGGFTGKYSVLRKITLTFPGPAVVSNDNIPNLHIVSEADEWFKTPNTIDFSKLSAVNIPGDAATSVADNYSDMFHVDHVD